MHDIKTRKGQANLYKTDKGTYAVNLPVEVSKEIYGKSRKRIALYLHTDSRENTAKALQHVNKIQDLLNCQNWEGLIKYEEELKPKVIKGTFTKLTLQALWKDYVKAKQEGWEVSYIQGDVKATTSLLASLPNIIIEEGIDFIINYLLENTTIQQTKRHLKQVSACLTWGKKRKLIKENPLPDFISTLSTKKSNDEDANICPFTLLERDLIIDAFRTGKFERFQGSHTQYADYVEFLFLTGARTSEALGLKWNHIDFERKVIIFQEAKVLATSGKKDGKIQKKGLKTQKKRIIPMNDKLYKLLYQRRESSRSGEQNVFENIDHHSFRSSAYKTVLSNLGIAYRNPYQTRHTFITILANHSNLKLHQIAKICGTSTKVIEEHYLATNADISQLPNI